MKVRLRGWHRTHGKASGASVEIDVDVESISIGPQLITIDGKPKATRVDALKAWRMPAEDGSDFFITSVKFLG